ncbi:hypothetical protein Pmani_010900 [Petrolisthes manimaculis]|uniref:Uncharacterized protein n=1 Tax=Petrolisthes manimaculis TaxID=1843537 RepID=A0AAE1Q255_9EUCA|nr:hypothetical protein Pmani_010900 [Petrolisthes manimaculis]
MHPIKVKEPLELLGVDLIGGANLGGYCQTRDVSFVHRLMMNFARPTASRGHQDQKRQEVHIKREEKVNAAQEKQTADYNRRKKKGSKIYDLSVGMHVLQSNLRNESRKGGKMEPKWTGPYKILDIDCNQRVALETVKNGKKLNRRVSYNQLRPYLHSQLHDASRSTESMVSLARDM